MNNQPLIAYAHAQVLRLVIRFGGGLFSIHDFKPKTNTPENPFEEKSNDYLCRLTRYGLAALLRI
jgi:hypothetical protein